MPSTDFGSMNGCGAFMQFGNNSWKCQLAVGNRGYNYLRQNNASQSTPEGLYFRKYGESTQSGAYAWTPWREIVSIDNTGTMKITHLDSTYHYSGGPTSKSQTLKIPYATSFSNKLIVTGGGNQLSLEGGVQFNMASGNMTITSGNITLSNGNVSASGGFFETSDERLKVFGQKIPVDFERLRKLKKNYFNWRDGEDTNLQIGVSAQEVKDIYPEIVQEDKDGNLTVAYDKLSVVALAAVDELYKKNQELESRIQKLEEVVNKLIG